MLTVSRREWGARPPKSALTPLRLHRLERVVLHYSGADRNQSVRSIQNYCMDTKNHRDIDYNDLVRGVYRYVGRGYTVGGHTLNHNSTSYGICVIGEDGDATDNDLITVLEIYDEVCRKAGRRVPLTDHQSVLGRKHTKCPGDQLHNWIVRGAPHPHRATSPKINKGDAMIFLKVKGRENPHVYKTDDLKTTRLMPEGSWPAIKKLIDSGHAVLVEEFDTIEALRAFGGPTPDTAASAP